MAEVGQYASVQAHQDVSASRQKGSVLRARALAPATAALGSLIAVTLAMRLWRFHPGVPLEYSGDALAHSLAVQQVLQNGWFWSDSRLGAPFAQHFQDWPMPDLLMLYVTKVFALFTSNTPAVVNALYLATYPLTALTAWWVLTRLGISRWIAVALSVLYSMMTYHQIRGEQHLFLSGYFMIPIGLWFALQLLNGDSLFPKIASRQSRLLQYCSRGSLRTAVLCVLIPMSGVYYAVFTLILVVLAATTRMTAIRSCRSAAPASVIVGIIVAVILASTLPTMIYHLDHAENLAGSQPATSDTEVYGLKLSQMLLPSIDHRIDAFRSVTNEYLATFPIPSEGRSVPIGLTAAFGLVWLLGTAIVTVLRPSRPSSAFERLRHLSVLATALLLIGTVGGFSTMISLLLTSQIRGWNRLSIVFAFLGLATVGILLDIVRHHLRGRGLSAALTPLLVISVGVVGVLDQTNDSWVPAYEETNALYLADQKYFREIEELMPTGAAIFELPRMQFPEVPSTVDLDAYAQLKPYIHTRDLKWSFGGVKGRFESEWQSRLDDVDPREFIKELVSAGFTGVYVARDGYEDRGAAIEASIANVTSAAPKVSDDQSKSFYDLRSYAASLKAVNPQELAAEKADLLFPVFVEQMTDYFPVEKQGINRFAWAIGSQAKLSVYDSTEGIDRSLVTFTLRTATGQPAQFVISWPDGRQQTLMSTGADLAVSRVIEAPENRSTIEISTTAARIPADVDDRELHFGLLDLDVSPAP